MGRASMVAFGWHCANMSVLQQSIGVPLAAALRNPAQRILGIRLHAES